MFFSDAFDIRKVNFMYLEGGAGAKIRSSTDALELGAGVL
jgi:hypothetical protein